MLPFSLQQDKRRNTWILKNVIDHVERIDVHTDDMFGAKDEGKESLLKRVLGVESKPAETKGNADTANSIGPIRPIGPIGETAKTKAETRDQTDTGRFNQDSDTPLLTPEEDAGDFQLFSETPKEAAKRDQAAEKAEADKLERAKAEARRNAPELPMESDQKSAASDQKNAGDIPAMTEDEYLGSLGVSMPVSDYMTDKQKIPHGETEAQRKQRIREADRIANEYAEARKKAKAEYRRKIEIGELREPTEIEKLEKAAAGNPDNESVQAARRALEKRRKKLAEGKRELSDQSDVSDQSDRSDNRGRQTETQDNPGTRGEVPKNYKEFDENGNWKITGEKNLGQLLDEFIAALKNKKFLKVITPKGDFHLEEFNGKFCYIDPDGRIRIWEEKSVRSVLDRFIVSNNPKIQIVEEDSTDAYKARKIQQDGSLLKPGDYAVFKHNGVFYEGEVASLGEKKVKLKTQSKMYGEQVISLPRESYLAHYAQSPFTLEGAALEKFNREYGSPEEYDNAKKSFMVQSAMRKEKPAREITSAAGKRADARTKRDVENFVGDGKLYSLQEDDAKIREAAKQRIKKLWNSDELKSGKDENIPLGHFSPRVIEVLRNEFGLKRINDQSQLNLKLTELHHIKLHHGDLTADQAAGLVDVFYNPDWIGYSSGRRKGNLLRFLQENEAGDNIGVSIYGGKNNIGYVKTFYVADSKNTLEEWKKSGIHLGPVANSDYQLNKSSRPGANPALIGPSTMPVDDKINSSSANVNPDSEKNPEKSLSGENTTYHTYQTYNTHESSDQSDQPDIRYSLQKNPDIQYSIVGEKGMENLSRESKEGLRRLENLQLAKSLLKAGAKMDAIKFQTGWELGGDGKWRTELPDLKVKRKGVLPDGTEYEKSGSDFYFNGKLGDYINAPEIFKAYPVLRFLPLRVDPTFPGITQGQYIEKSIDLNTGSSVGGSINLDIGGDANPNIIESILVHEVQHAIQDIEGFPRGASPEYFKQYPMHTEEGKTKIREAKAAIEKLKDRIHTELKDKNYHYQMRADRYAWLNDNYWNLADERQTIREMEAIEQEFKQAGKMELLDEYRRARDKMDMAKSNYNVNPYTAYRRVAGEVESRNAERRSKMPLEQRLKTLLSRTEDVAEEDKIYLEKAVGEAMMTVGDRAREIIDSVPVEDTEVELLPSSVTPDVVKTVFESFPRTVIAADGKNILLHNPQILFDKNTEKEIIESDAKRMQNRLDHLTRGGENHDSKKFDKRKVKWLPRTPETLQKAQFKLQADNCLGYVRRYQEGFHFVLVSPDGVAYYETGIDNALISQFKENFTGSKGDFIVVWESGRLTDSTVKRRSATDPSGAPLPVTNQGNLTPSPAEVNTDSQKNPENSSSDQSDQSDMSDQSVKSVKDYSLRKHHQVNPIVVNGQVQAEYADLLNNKEYTPETISEWDQKAIAWIDRQGGIEAAAEMIANDTEHSDRHVATLVRRHILNSEFASSLPADIRMAVELKNIDEGKAWGREGVARRLAALTLKNIETVKALFRKLHEKMPDPEKVKLRNKILEQTGVDINNLPDDLVNDKSKLDKVLRAELANTSSKLDKAYEYWINAILSAPTTHSANIIGNTANALYELGPKRFAEAAVNALAKRKDAATFGEFREMWNALDFRSAWQKAKTAFDLETLTQSIRNSQSGLGIPASKREKFEKNWIFSKNGFVSCCFCAIFIDKKRKKQEVCNMRTSVLAMILAGGEGRRLAPLTDQRAKPAVPFGGKYRIIDFVLSNFINSGIDSIFVLTQFKSQSLMEHIINGWNISNIHRRGRFIIPVPAQMQTEDKTWYMGTADAIYQNAHLIEDFSPDLVAVFGGDHIYRMDISQMVDFHVNNNAIATVAAIPVPIEDAHQFGIIEVDADWRITGFQEKPENPTPLPNDPTMALASMGNYIFGAQDILQLLNSDHADPSSSHDFGKNIIPSLVSSNRLFAYNFYLNKIPGQKTDAQPYWRDVGTLKAFFEANMDLRATTPQLDLYNEQWPIYNYHFSLPPAKFVHNEDVDIHGLTRIGKAINSIVCDGCIVSGSTVTNSILFNSVYVHSYATVHNCILLNDVDIGEHCRIRNAIIDKHNMIPPGTTIGYDRKEDEKHYIVTELGPEYGPDAWLTVIPKDRHHQQLELPKSFVTHDNGK